MGIFLPCLKGGSVFNEETIPLKSSSHRYSSPNKRTVLSGADLYKNDSDLFSVDPEIQKFLEDFSSNDGDIGYMDEAFEQEILDGLD